MKNYIVVSHKNWEDAKYVGFDKVQDAFDYLNKEQGDFRDRIFYNCENGLPQDFLDSWCWEGQENEHEAELEGYVWDENLEQFTHLMESMDA